MRNISGLMFAAGLTSLIGACASQRAGENPGQPAEAVSADSVRECRYAEGTGSKMRYRICHSQAEWAAIDAATADAQDTDDFFRGVRERASTGAGGGGGAALPGQ